MNIKIASHNIPIKRVSEQKMKELSLKPKEGISGLYVEDQEGNKSIYIDMGLSKKNAKPVLAHEIMEAVNDIYEMELSHIAICVIGEVFGSLLKDDII